MRASALLLVALAIVRPGRAAAAEPVRKIVAAAPEGSPWADAVNKLGQRATERTRGRAMACASRSRRSCGIDEPGPSRSNSLRATLRSSSGSYAAKTSPIPPRPMRSIRR